eukprot:5933839-Pyramimonas_sp.AAC.1
MSKSRHVVACAQSNWTLRFATPCPGTGAGGRGAGEQAEGLRRTSRVGRGLGPVSYTHLTLPTILLV